MPADFQYENTQNLPGELTAGFAVAQRLQTVLCDWRDEQEVFQVWDKAAPGCRRRCMVEK
jgi:hypothetical protein